MIAIEKLIILSIFIIILLLSLYMIFGTKPVGDNLNYQIEMRQCCTTYRAYGCEYGYLQNLECAGEPMIDVAIKLGLVSGDNDSLLKKFCNCEGSEDA